MKDEKFGRKLGDVNAAFFMQSERVANTNGQQLKTIFEQTQPPTKTKKCVIQTTQI